MKYNIMTEIPWIPVVNYDTELHHVTPVHLLETLHNWIAINGDTPTQTAAIHRWVLALAAATDITGINDFVKLWDDRLHLIHDDTPYGQSPELSQTLGIAQQQTRASLTCLDSTKASGNNALLWDHTDTATQVTMTPAQAIRGLITTQATVLGGNCTVALVDGVKGFVSADGLGGPISGRATVIAHGGNLAQTIQTALDMIPNVPGDTAYWQRDIPVALKRTDRPATGPIDYLTWNTRHILLGWNPEQTLVTSAVATPALTRTITEEQILEYDPTAIPSDNQAGTVIKPLYGSAINRYTRRFNDGEITLPDKYDHIHHPVTMELLGQRASNGKYIGTDHAYIHHTPPPPAPETTTTFTDVDTDNIGEQQCLF